MKAETGAEKMELVSGKTKTSSNWDRAKIDMGSFTSLSPDALFQGEWVWITAGEAFFNAVMTDRRECSPLM